MNEAILIALGGGGGAIGAYVGTVIANKTDIEWLKATVKRLERDLNVAHARIDSILKKP